VKDGHYSEQKVAIATGFPREEVAKAREELLEKGPDWIFENRRIALTERGLEKLLQHFKALREKRAPATSPTVSKPARKPRARKAPASSEASPLKDVVVEQVTRKAEQVTVTRKCMNPRLLFGRVNGAEVRIRVREAKPFAVGMIIPAFRESTGLYYYEGPLPRNGRLFAK
jgi:hypothetical protein